MPVRPWASVGSTYWDQRGKIDGLMYVISDYSDIVAFALVTAMIAGIVWGVRHRVLRFHPLVVTLIVVGLAVYWLLPRIMFDTYMTDQRVPIGVAFMLFACGDLELRRRLVRRAFMVILVVLISARLIEIDYNWSQLSDSTSEFRSSVRRIAPGSKVFVAYADRALGEDVRDLGLVHAACIATIERSALVTTVFTVAGKQVLHVRPEFRDYADRRDGTPPSTAQLIVAAVRPTPNTPAFWLNWTKFDYLYVLFTEDEAPNPDPIAPETDRRWRPFPALQDPQTGQHRQRKVNRCRAIARLLRFPTAAKVRGMTVRPRRSVLYMPGSNARALEKAKTLAADGVILDLEDSVAPDAKDTARRQVVEAVKAGGFGTREVFIRVNGVDTSWHADDLSAAAHAAPDAILVPKISNPETLELIGRRLLDMHSDHKIRIWAMIETPLALFNILAIAAEAKDSEFAPGRLCHGHQRSRQGHPCAPSARPRTDAGLAVHLRGGGAHLRHRHPRRRL